MRSLLLIDPAARIFSAKERTLYFLVAGFFISLFLPNMPVVNNIVTAVLFLLALTYNSFSEKWGLLKERKEIILMLLFYLLHIISAVFSMNRHEAQTMLVLRLPLLIFPLSLGLIRIREELKDRILLSFIIIVTLVSVICMAVAIHRYQETGDAGNLYEDSLTGVTHMQANYFAMFVTLALFSYIYLLRKKSFAIEYIGLAYLSIALLLVFHFMLTSRLAVFTLYSVLVLLGLAYIIRKKNYLQGGILIVGLLAVIYLLVRFVPEIGNRFNELDYPGYRSVTPGVKNHYNLDLTEAQWNGTNIRLAVWKCGWQVIRQHWLFGVPLGDKQDQLMAEYRAKGYEFAVDTHRNMHNNYLDIFVTFGLLGLLLFLFGYIILPIRRAILAKDILSIIMIGSLAAGMATETYMDRSMGCLLLAFFLSFISASAYYRKLRLNIK